MTDTDNTPQATSDNTDMGYAQALKYGQDLARLYTLEKAKRRELELANQKLQAILETAPNGLAVLDEAMTIVETNPRFEALVERNGGCVGRPLTEVLPSEQLAASLEITSREGARFAEVEVVLSKPVNRTLHVIGAPLSAGDYRGWVIGLHDLTERKRLEGLKEEFINIAAHELRTPLAIILGYTGILREDMGDSGDTLTVASIDAIIQAASRLKTVISELVEFAAAKSRSASDVGVDRFDLREVIQHTVNSIAHQASYKEVIISVQAADKPLMVSGDRVILAQAIGHLLENAVKFNRPGGQVYVRATQENSETILEIEDTGTGIPHADLDRIFDMFYQVEEHMTRAEGGLGMGLSIAKRGVELHGGQITVESTLGRGSCFRVTFPSSVEQAHVLPQTRLDTAHQQTLAYGRDLARAFAAQQTLARRLRHVSELGKELLARLEQLTLPGTAEETAIFLDEARALARQLIEDAA
jgi:two-component system phosphate regulon sensor histidine kinase PhoR